MNKVREVSQPIPRFVSLPGAIISVLLSFLLPSLADTVTPQPTERKPAATNVEANLKKTAREIKDDEFASLRTRRRDVIERIDKNKSEIEAPQTRIAGLRATEAEFNKKLETLPAFDAEQSNEWKARLADAKAAYDELKAKGKAQDQTDDDFSKNLTNFGSQIVYFQNRLREADSVTKDRDTWESKSKSTDSDIEKTQADLDSKLKQRDELTDEQAVVEDEINARLIPETAQNIFKLWITVAFSCLVGFVIAGFFIISWKDENVRRAIFSGQSGIQFLTLFSLVIAIILFGITDILEGKELAALLGGLSGYILGRVTDSDRQPQTAPRQQ